MQKNHCPKIRKEVFKIYKVININQVSYIYIFLCCSEGQFPIILC